jgi:integrase
MRPRWQDGHLTLSGKRHPAWFGLYYETVQGESGKPRRVHRRVRLGAKDTLTKTDAKRKLTEILARYQSIRPDSSVTLRQFIEGKWLPLKEAKWKASTKLTSLGILQKQVIEPLGNIPLCDFDRARLQQHLNDLAVTGKRCIGEDGEILEGYSQSIVQHTASFLKNIFDTALDMDYITKDPARRLEIPRTFPTRTINPDNNLFTGKPFLSVDELRSLLGALEGRNRLIVMLAGLMAMRPGEIFALTWDAWRDDTLFIMRRVYRKKFDFPKTTASMAQIPVPKVVQEALGKWRAECPDDNRHASIFPGKVRGTVLDQYNFSNRTLKHSGTMAVSAFTVTFQALRRTWATHASSYGAGLKEIECVLRHKASLNFTTGVYVQGIKERILTIMDDFSNAVCAGLPEHASSIPIESEKAVCCGHDLSQVAS